MADDWEFYAHTLESEIGDIRRERDELQKALKKLQVVADERRATIRELSESLHANLERLEAAEEASNEEFEERLYYQCQYVRALAALAYRDLAAAGVPDGMIRRYLKASDDGLGLEENLENIYYRCGRISLSGERAVSDFWLGMAYNLEEVEGKTSESDLADIV